MNEIQSVPQPAVSTVKTLLSSESVKARLNEILGKKAAGFCSSVISVSNSPQLRGANPNTVVSAAVVAATLDLPINPSLGFAYIVPYRNKGNLEAQFQLGYKGFIQLAQRSGQYESINVTDIREGEIEYEDILTGEMRFRKLPDDKRCSAKIVGYASYFRLLNGFRKSLYVTKEEIDEHAKKYSQSYRNDKTGSSLWATQFDLMAKKTVIKLLISKYGPLSVDMQMAQKFDQSVVNDFAMESIEDAEAQYVDNQDIEEIDVAEDSSDNETAAQKIANASAAFSTSNV